MAKSTDSRIPAARYGSPEQHALEWRRLWPRVWLMAAHVSELRAPGDFARFDIGHEPILVVRQDDGGVRAFYNVCQHRGTLLCSARRGRGAAVFRCPYHGWTWTRRGTLAELPDAERFGAGAARDDLDLAQLRCEERAGFVWVTMDPQAEPLADYLAEVGEQLEAYRLQEFVLTQDLSAELACNWKASVDAHNESYHVHSLHPDTLGLLDDTAVTTALYARHSRLHVPFGAPSARLSANEPSPALAALAARLGVDAGAYGARPQALRAALQRAAREKAQARGAHAAALSDDQLIDTYQYYVFPNLQLNQRADELLLFRHRPHPDDPSRTWFDQQSFLRAAPGAPARAEHRVLAPGGPGFGPVTDANLAMVGRQQTGLRSRGFRGLLPGADEACIRHMHDVLDRYLEH